MFVNASVCLLLLPVPAARGRKLPTRRPRSILMSGKKQREARKMEGRMRSSPERVTVWRMGVQPLSAKACSRQVWSKAAA